MAFDSKDTAAFKGVWVFCEQREGVIMSTSYQLLSEGRKLANDLGVELCGVVLGKDIKEEYLKALGGYGADKVYYCNHELLDVYTTDAYTNVICDLVEEKKPENYLNPTTNNAPAHPPLSPAQPHLAPPHPDAPPPKIPHKILFSASIPSPVCEETGRIVTFSQGNSCCKFLSRSSCCRLDNLSDFVNTITKGYSVAIK